MNSAISKQVEENLARVRGRMAAAASRAGRAADSVHLVAVTKYAELAWVRALLETGQRDLGENRPQQLLERAELLPKSAQWHLIGSLQRNKVRKVLPVACLIHSVDSVRLAEDLGRIAGELQLRPRILLEVNLSGEASKHGFSREQILSDWRALLQIPHLHLSGLMTMAPLTEDPEAVRWIFRGLREIRDELRSKIPEEFRQTEFRELSMGMSGDFEVAIEEGATLVRVGSALWEGLPAEA